MGLHLLETKGPGSQGLDSLSSNMNLGFKSHFGPQSSQFPFQNPVALSERIEVSGVLALVFPAAPSCYLLQGLPTFDPYLLPLARGKPL